jgi:hypothetical protein
MPRNSTLLSSMARSPNPAATWLLVPEAVPAATVAELADPPARAGSGEAAFVAATGAVSLEMFISRSTRCPSCAVTISMRWVSSPASNSASWPAASCIAATLLV